MCIIILYCKKFIINDKNQLSFLSKMRLIMQNGRDVLIFTKILEQNVSVLLYWNILAIYLYLYLNVVLIEFPLKYL